MVVRNTGERVLRLEQVRTHGTIAYGELRMVQDGGRFEPL